MHGVKMKDNLNVSNLLRIYETEISKNVKNKKKLYDFEINKMQYIEDIINMLNNGVVGHKHYNIFLIFEPKCRLVMSLSVKDKVINHFVTRYILETKLCKYLDCRNVATRKGMGTDYAIRKVIKYINILKRKYKTFYVLKLDISKYFYSIDHEVLKGLLIDKLDDYEYNIVSEIIDTTNKEYINKTINKLKEDRDIPNYLYGKGLPIGNMTSQFLSIYYLYKLDYFIVHDLGLKYYIRYMDDFIILEKGKVKAKLLLKEISIFLNKELHLNLNNKSRIYPNKMGINFCGYRIFETHILLRNRSKKKIKNNIKIWKKLYINNKINYKKMELSFNSWLGHARHANSFNLINKVYDSLKMIITK